MEKRKQKRQRRDKFHGKKLTLRVQVTLQQLFHTCHTRDNNNLHHQTATPLSNRINFLSDDNQSKTELNPVTFTARVDKHKQKYARVINDVTRVCRWLTKYAQLAVTPITLRLNSLATYKKAHEPKSKSGFYYKLSTFQI